MKWFRVMLPLPVWLSADWERPVQRGSGFPIGSWAHRLRFTNREADTRP